MQSIQLSRRVVALTLLTCVLLSGGTLWYYQHRAANQSTVPPGIAPLPPAQASKASSPPTVSSISSNQPGADLSTIQATKPDEMYGLLQQQKNVPSGDPQIDILEQFDLIIDQKLGKDFPRAKREKIAQIQLKMLSDKEVLLRELSTDPTIQEQTIREIRTLVDRAGKEMAQILNDDEYEILFDIEKDKPLSEVFMPPR